MKQSLNNYHRRFNWVTLLKFENDNLTHGGDTWREPPKIVTVYDCYIATNVIDLNDPQFIHVLYCDETLRYVHTSYDMIVAYDVIDEPYDGNKKRKCGSRKKRRSTNKAGKKRSRRTSRK